MKLDAPAAIVLDPTPLGLLVRPAGDGDGDECKAWLVRLERFGCRFFVPQSADFALRRALLRAGQTASVSRLDAFLSAEPDRFLPLSTPAFRLAATLWVQAGPSRRSPPATLAEDALLAAQARLLSPAVRGLSAIVVATDRPARFQSLTTAALWREIDV